MCGPAGIASVALRGPPRPSSAARSPFERDLDLLVAAERLEPEAAAAAADADLVLGVERKDVAHEQAAARAERQAVECSACDEPRGAR